MRGGPSPEYEISLKTGEAVLRHIPTEKYEKHDILVDRSGAWHFDGVPTSLRHVAEHVDIVFNALHGSYGEDGIVQQELGNFSVPYTGSGVFASNIAMNKGITRDFVREIPVKMPRYEIVQATDDIERVQYSLFRTLSLPVMVKPLTAGSSIGISLVTDFFDLANAIAEALRYSSVVLVEEYIYGKEAACGVIEEFRAEKQYALPPAEIRISKKYPFFNYEAKYNGSSENLCPGNFSKDEKQLLEQSAIAIHKALGLRHYSRSDFIINPSGVYFLEVNTLPGLGEQSIIPHALTAVGATLGDFIDHVVGMALAQKNN